ncbi:MAG TPA: hypothetical protein VFP90_04855 [Gemmatimonadaceae bacterium]|nr:hypothetical protein [Gemmatimonadaceae bacterium]
MHATFAMASFGAARTHLRKARQAKARGDLELFRQHVGIAAVKRETAKLHRRLAMDRNTRTRAMMVTSFAAACRQTAAGEALKLNAASCAGLLLQAFGTTKAALEACARMPGDGPWPLAGRYLAELADTEGADTVPPAALAAGGGR